MHVGEVNLRISVANYADSRRRLTQQALSSGIICEIFSTYVYYGTESLIGKGFILEGCEGFLISSTLARYGLDI